MFALQKGIFIFFYIVFMWFISIVILHAQYKSPILKPRVIPDGSRVSEAYS